MAKKKNSGGKKSPPVSLSVNRTKKELRKKGIPVPKFKDEKGKFRKTTSKELKEFQRQFKQGEKFYGEKFNKKDWAKTLSYNLDLDYSYKKKRKQVPENRKKAVKVIPQRRDDLKYIQQRSIVNFALSEAEDFGRKVFVKRKGRLTPIDSPDMFLQLQKATKDAKNRYAKALREKSKRTGIKVSDVFFYAIFEEGENTIIDIDSIEYTGLTENEIQKAGLR
jgi:hypothetical protein